jgi:hypothetical protein
MDSALQEPSNQYKEAICLSKLMSSKELQSNNTGPREILLVKSDA